MPDAATWTAIVAPVTTMLSGLGGYWLAGRNESSRDRRALAREEGSRRTALAEKLEEQRHTFQRDTLIELQDELQKLIRITARISLQDQKTLQEHGQLVQLPEGLSDEHFEVSKSVRRLQTRVLDAELRQAISDFLVACNRSAIALKDDEPSVDETIAIVVQALDRASASYTALSELLGTHVRRELDRRYLANEQAGA